MAYRPPARYSVSTNRQGHKTLAELPDDIPTWTTNSGKSNGNKRRRMADEDSYFDEDEDDPPPPSKNPFLSLFLMQNLYLAKSTYDPFNPTGDGAQTAPDDDEELDPLDAFMAENNKKAAIDKRLVLMRYRALPCWMPTES